MTRDERRDQLLNVAGDLLAQGGFDAVTMEGVAERAGVSKALPYAHFDNAAQLLLALFEREMLDHVQRVVDALEHSDDPTRTGIGAFFDTLEQRHVLFSMLLQPTSTPGPLRNRQLESRSDNDRYFAKRYRNGLGLDPKTALVAGALVLDSLGGTVRAWTDGYASREEIEEVFTIYTEAGLRALAAHRASLDRQKARAKPTPRRAAARAPAQTRRAARRSAIG